MFDSDNYTAATCFMAASFTSSFRILYIAPLTTTVIPIRKVLNFFRRTCLLCKEISTILAVCQQAGPESRYNLCDRKHMALSDSGCYTIENGSNAASRSLSFFFENFPFFYRVLTGLVAYQQADSEMSPLQRKGSCL